MLRLREGVPFVVQADTVNYALKSTAEDCPMRRLVIDMMWEAYMKAPDDEHESSKWLWLCLKGVSPSQVVKIVWEMKNSSQFDIKWKTGSWKELVKGGKSIAEAPRYQVGMLKVAEEPESGTASGSLAR